MRVVYCDLEYSCGPELRAACIGIDRNPLPRIVDTEGSRGAAGRHYNHCTSHCARLHKARRQLSGGNTAAASRTAHQVFHLLHQPGVPVAVAIIDSNRCSIEGSICSLFVMFARGGLWFYLVLVVRLNGSTGGEEQTMTRAAARLSHVAWVSSQSSSADRMEIQPRYCPARPIVRFVQLLIRLLAARVPRIVISASIF